MAKFRHTKAAKDAVDLSDRLHVLDENDDPASDNNNKWSGSFFFVQAADTQFGLIERYIKKLPEPLGWTEEIQLAEEFVDKCNKMQPKPRFVTICGDLIDEQPANERRRQQVVDFKKVFKSLDRSIPLVCVCGNHDVGDEPTEESIKEYRRDFGDDYFHFVSGGVLFIVINSQFYKHRANVEAYAREHDNWLERMLAKCRQFKYSILLEHIPWFLNSPNEEDEYFNINREIRLKWLKKFKDAGVDKILCGHYHRNSGGWFDETLELVVTSAVGGVLGNDKSGARIVKLLEKGIKHQYFALEELPEKISLVADV